MNRFFDEEYHMWKDFEFCITDDDIEKLKQGKTLYGDVNDEFAVILKYYEEEKNKALEQKPCKDAIHRDRTVQDFVDKCKECGREKVLDKIMEEIEQVKSIMNEEIINNNRKDLINFVNGLNQSLVIVERYKAESENKHISGKEQE